MKYFVNSRRSTEFVLWLQNIEKQTYKKYILDACYKQKNQWKSFSKWGVIGTLSIVNHVTKNTQSACDN